MRRPLIWEWRTGCRWRFFAVFFWWLNFISFFLFFWFGSILLSIIDCPLISPLRPRRGFKAQSAKAPRRNLPVRNRFRNRKKKKKERNQTEERKKERKKASERSVTSSSACGRYVDVGIFFCFFLRSFFFAVDSFDLQRLPLNRWVFPFFSKKKNQITKRKNTKGIFVWFGRASVDVEFFDLHQFDRLVIVFHFHLSLLFDFYSFHFFWSSSDRTGRNDLHKRPTTERKKKRTTKKKEKKEKKKEEAPRCNYFSHLFLLCKRRPSLPEPDGFFQRKPDGNLESWYFDTGTNRTIESPKKKPIGSFWFRAPINFFNK